MAGKDASIQIIKHELHFGFNFGFNGGKDLLVRPGYQTQITNRRLR